MKKILGSVFVFLLINPAVFGQLFSLSDTTIIFKNQEGRILTKDEVKEFMKGVFSIRQENKEGKKTITIIPTGKDERSQHEAKTDAFRNSLRNKPVKQFTLTDLDGKSWNSNELKGKIIVFNFWFTACKPCILEIPALNRLVAENQDSSVIFIAPAPEDLQKIKKFLKKYPFAYHIVPASLTFITELNIESFPTHLVIDKQGIIRQVFIGYADDIKGKLQTEIDKLK